MRPPALGCIAAFASPPLRAGQDRSKRLPGADLRDVPIERRSGDFALQPRDQPRGTAQHGVIGGGVMTSPSMASIAITSALAEASCRCRYAPARAPVLSAAMRSGTAALKP